MAEPQVTRETLKAMATLLGLELNEHRLDALLPQAQRTAEAMGQLEVLNLESVEPALVFSPEAE